MIVGVQDVVRGAGMIGIAREHLLRDLAGLPPHRQRIVAARQRGQQRQRIERLRLIVCGMVGGDLRHGLRVRGGARGRVCPSPNSASTARMKPCSRGVFAFAMRASGVGPSFASAARPLRDFLEKPQRLAEAHRLAPVRQRERRIDLLRRPKRVDRVFVAEAMQPRDAAKEVGLRRRRCRNSERRRGQGAGLGT